MKSQIQSFKVYDNFCSKTDEVRQSFLQSGFGKWTPNKGIVGSSIYEGMNYTGLHSYLLASLTIAMGCPIFPNSMFARVTNKDTEKAYVHSDRNDGAYTCLVYLSEHDEVSGTGFYRHRETGMTEMPTFLEMRDSGMLEKLRVQMVEGDAETWEQIDFVRGLYNRAVIFHAPLFHSRVPSHGIGDSEGNGRMIWGCHFHTIESLQREMESPKQDISSKEALEIDRADYLKVVSEFGLTHEQMRQAKTVWVDSPNSGVIIKSSDLDGAGVFADRSFPQNGTVALAWEKGQWTNWGRFVNHSLHPSVHPVIGTDGSVYFMASKNIMAGDEITANYRSMRETVLLASISTINTEATKVKTLA